MIMVEEKMEEEKAKKEKEIYFILELTKST